MKPATSVIIIALLAIGAVLYSGGPILGMTAAQPSSSASSGFGPNPLEAGALAAKPNGVPTCLTLCQPGGAEDPDNDGDSDINSSANVVQQPSQPVAATTTAPVTRMVTVVQPVRVVAAQPQPVVVQHVAATALPATGPSALTTATGLSAMTVTAYYFLQARRRTRPSKPIS